MASKITEVQEYDAYELAARLSPKELKELALMRAKLDSMPDIDDEDDGENEQWEYEYNKLIDRYGGAIYFPERFIHDVYKTVGSLKFLDFVLHRSNSVSKIAYYATTEHHMQEMLYLSINAKVKLIAFTLPKMHCRKLGLVKRHWEESPELKPLLNISKNTGFTAKFTVHEYFQFLKSYLK
jgi:hypothetical protein